jgi:hypothetical protein
MVRPSYRCRPCGLTVHPYHNGLTASSTSAVWMRITTIDRPLHQRRPCGFISQPWLDCLIKVDHAGLTSFFTTMVTTQCCPCGFHKHHPYHGSDVNVAHVVLTRFITAMAVTSTLPMWYLQDSSQPWYRHQCRPCGSYKILPNHGSTALINSAMRVLQASSLPWLGSLIKPNMWSLHNSSQPWLDRLFKVSYVEPMHSQTHRPTVSSMSAVHNLDPC